MNGGRAGGDGFVRKLKEVLGPCLFGLCTEIFLN